MRDAVIGVDLGTQSTKAVLVSADGEQLAAHQVPVTFERPHPGWAEQDPRVQEESALEAIRGVAVAAPDDVRIAALSFAGQMGGCIGIDAAFEPVTVYEMWLDTRADTDRQEVLVAAGDQIRRANGIIPFVGPRVRRWLREDPSLLERLARVIPPSSYVVGRLTGASADAAICDYTQANLFGCYDAEHCAWDSALAAAVGLPEHLLPRLVPSTAIAGLLSPTAAARCGLPVGLLVAAGLGDGTGGWLSGGGIVPGAAMETGGSSGNFAITVDRFTPDPHGMLTCMPSPITGLWYLIGFTTGTGLAHRWLADLFAHGDFQQLDQMAAQVPPGQILCVPHLHGRVTPFEPWVKGAFVGTDERTGPGAFYRSFLEAVSFEISEWVEEARRLIPDLALRDVSGIGGGAQSSLWSQIKADVLGVPYVRLQSGINAARGAALVAAASINLVRLDQPSWYRPQTMAERRFEPDEAHHARYRELLPIHAALMASLEGVYQKMAAIRDS